MSQKKGDGIFIAAVLVITTMLMAVVGFGELGGDRYGTFALSLLVGAGGVSYFALKGAGEFGLKLNEGTLLNGAVALVGALAFTVLLVQNAAVLSTISAAVALACAVPFVAIMVRSRGKTISG